MTTAIEWTDATWNPTTGCDKVSPGCGMERWPGDDVGGCYAMAMAKRLKAMGQDKYQRDGDPRTSGPGFGITEHPETLDMPLRWKKPRKIFVNSMSDLFHKGVSNEFIARVFATMAMAPQHVFQVLTKRHDRMRSLLSRPDFEESVRLKVRHYTESDVYWREVANWPLPNVWLGVSVEDQKRADLRIPALIGTPAAVRWLSCEPLLGVVDLDRYLWLTGASTAGPFYDALGRQRGRGGIGGMTITTLPARDLHWVVVGGESGPGARPMSPEWPRRLRDQCVEAEVPFLFKQRGAWTWDHRAGDHWEWAEPDAWVCAADGRMADEGSALADGGSWTAVWKVGKHDAGRELDRETWDQYPAAAS